MSIFAAAENRAKNLPTMENLFPFSWGNTGFWHSGSTQAGVDVTPHNVLSLSTFFMGKMLISEALAHLPFAPYLRQQEDGRTKTRKYKEHVSYNLVSKRPHEYISAFNFIKTLQGWACTYDNGYAYIDRNNLGQPISLTPIHPTRVQPKYKNGELFYMVDGSRVVHKDMFHLLGYTDDGFTGQSRVSLGKEAIGKALAAQRFGAQYFGKGIHTSGFIKHPGRLKDKNAVQRLKESFTKQYAGPNNAFGVGVLEEGAEFEKMESNPEEAQLTETARLDARIVADYLKIPVVMLNQIENGTFNNVEQLSIQFVNQTLMPWAVNWQQECWDKLLSKNDKNKRDVFFKFNFKALLKGDMKARANFNESMARVGAYSPNHILEKEDENGYEGGDVHVISPGAKTIEQLKNSENETGT